MRLRDSMFSVSSRRGACVRTYACVHVCMPCTRAYVPGPLHPSTDLNISFWDSGSSRVGVQHHHDLDLQVHELWVVGELGNADRLGVRDAHHLVVLVELRRLRASPQN